MQELINIFEVGKTKTGHLWVFLRLAKLMEEAGELAEAVTHSQGLSPHKTMKEPLEGEVADVVICALDVLTQTYPSLSSAELLEMLCNQLNKKTNKWRELK